MKISIIIPVFNEEKTISQILDKVEHVSIFGHEKEIIVVDDSSFDGTEEILKKYAGKIKYFRNQTNSGKGFSVRTGIEKATGDVVIIQDADMEYDPNDFEKLIKPIIDGKANVVFGSRFTGEHNNLFFTHLIANKFITLLIDVLFNTTLSDVEVGYKVFRKSVLDKIKLNENTFGFEIEVTAKILKLKEKIFEVPISYTGRDYEEGKKIGMKDGFQALWCIFKYRFIR
jgi:glycosyltransferase involved in cell wall biosynthesis